MAEVALTRGLEVRALARREWLGPPAVPLADRVFGRLPYFFSSDALQGCDAVIHCAVSTASDLGIARAVNVAGTLELARRARDAGVRSFVFLSTQSARAETPSVYGRSKHEAETALLADPSLGAIVIRPGLVCGSGGLFRRLATTVMRAPIVPLLAGSAPVQPVFVDDLVEGILRCAADPDRFAGQVFEVGLARPLALRDFVALIATESGRRARVVPVPTSPVELTVRALEGVGLSLPVSSTNIVGAREVHPMDTAQANEALGLPDRPAREIVRLGLRRDAHGDTAGPTPMRTLLIGAGRIGIVHAVTLSRLPGIVLAGMLDRRRGPVSLLQSIGISAPGWTSEPPAMTFDAAVIATPPSTHSAIAGARADRGERVLIEKPAARAPSDLPALVSLAERYGERALVGYLMPRMPQLRPWLARLRSGELGAVRSFTGITLLSLIDARSGPRWETTRTASGGGVLINSGTHVLSLIHAAFGPPRATRTEFTSRFSREVEDSAVVHLDYGSFAGTHYASWCMPGFPRQENRLIVHTDRGVLTLSITAASFDAHGAIAIDHQLDHDLGFNLAPDYAGGGIAAELRELAGHRFDGPLASPMTLERALEVERLLFSLYEQAQRVETFSHAEAVEIEPPTEASRASGVYLDLRDASPEIVERAQTEAAGLLVRTAQLGRVRGRADVAITVPDFLGYTRLITDRQRSELLRRFGLRGVIAAATAATLAVARERSIGFWPVAGALLAGELSRIPDDFTGTLLLHPYLADLAIALDRTRVLQALLDQLRTKRRARVGVHSNLGREAANAVLLLERGPDMLSLLVSPNRSDHATLARWFADDGRRRPIALMAEVGPAPLRLHKLALAHPERWAPAGVPLVVNGLAVCAADAGEQERWSSIWSSVFPGIHAPPREWVA